MSGIVKDSSIWFSPDNFAGHTKRDPYLRMGVVKRVFFDETLGELRYFVEFNDTNDRIPCNCRMMSRFGGVFNYEDTIHRGYNFVPQGDATDDFDTKAGDMVLVGFLNGQSREGIIIGGLAHAARKTDLDITNGPQFKSEFNGIEEFINKDGEFTVTFKGQPTNIDELEKMPSKRIPVPKYDTAVGSTYYKFDKTGSWTLSDNATSKPQSIGIDKPGGKISILSGAVSVVLDKNAESVTVVNKTTTVTSQDAISGTTKDYSMDASATAKIKSPKVAFGSADVELLDHLIKIVTALGKVQPISPVGKCTPLMATPEWPDVDALKAKVESIKGNI